MLAEPLRIVEIAAAGCAGTIGVTSCPGKHDPSWGDFGRDLDADLDAIRDWGARAVLTLIEDFEFELLNVRALPEGVAGRGIAWYHLPIRDVSIPNAAFETSWETVGTEVLSRLRGGERVLVHCRGGFGRAGTIAARLLVELGMEPAQAIASVRRARPGAIESPEQDAYVRNRQWISRG
jgi:protein-tyrosine phosphatase